MAKDLMGWAAEQPNWVKDSLRRIAVAADHSLEPEGADCILDNVHAAAGAGSSPLRHERRRWMLPVLLSLLLLLGLFAEQVLALFQPRFAETGQWPLRILALANGATVLMALAPTMLKFRGDRRLTYSILVGAAAAQMLALVLLVPRLGATGAALAYLLAMLAMYGTFSAHAWTPEKDVH